MDLAWGFTSTSGHMPINKLQEKALDCTVAGHGKISVNPALDPRKAKRRNRLRERKSRQTNHRQNPQKSTSSWGDLDTTSEHFLELLEDQNSPRLPSTAQKPSKKDARPKPLKRKNSKSSWAGLGLDLDDDDNEADKFKDEAPKPLTRKNSKSSWAGLDFDLDDDDNDDEDNKCNISPHSAHSKSSWAGLDIFGEFDTDDEDDKKRYGGYSTRLVDPVYDSESDEDESEIGSFGSETTAEEEEDINDNGSDNESPLRFGNGSPKETSLWLDFDLDELSDSDSSEWDTEDDTEDDTDSETDDESESS